jgi:hypothetical protein
MALLTQSKENDFYVSTWKHHKPISQLLQQSSMQEFDTILELSS